MLYIQGHAASNQLRALFDSQLPASLRCFGVLDEIVPGEIICDDAQEPTWAVVREKAYGTTYFGGNLTSEQMAEIIAKLRVTGDVLVGFDPDSKEIILLPPQPDYHGKTLEFLERSKQVDLDKLIASLPSSVRIEEIDTELIKQCLWYEDTIASYGSIEQFFQHGRGFCLMDKQDILCEVYVTGYMPQLAEAAAVTHEGFRRSGYAAALCAHVIQTYEQEGIAVYWNCAKQNIASAALAHKLGYQTEREYTLLAWFKPTEGDIA